ncbi:hypothetical protein EJ08DRAFT_189830 [Tothia fuscella]|uniref:Uncharacterized protein n=1 Tax=Tothia fuscella TaxID=1048955 RepID=A0A9P4NT26_9PEZI|nr:hypothetical protein EJ08DRAFT_189830 [Tothia fuscella]
MRALLSSPLLARKSRAASFSKCGTTQSNHVQMSKNPLDWLHDKIASATVTLEDISSCLNTIWHSNLVVHERDQVIKTVKPASKIVSWLRTSGQIHTMAILGSQRPHKNNRPHLLANMLVLEERQDIILDWLKIESGKPVLYGPVLVNHWLHAEIAHGSGLQGAMKIVLDIFGNSATLSRNMIRACEAAIMPHIKNSAASVDADLYGNFSAALMKSLTWAPSRERDAAFLALCHPATPSSANGLGYVRNLTAKPVAETSAFSVANTRMHIEFCLELANVLIAEDQHENAKFVLQFTQTRFPQYLGIEAVVAAPAEEKRAKLQEDEAANIQQLDGLLAL